MPTLLCGLQPLSLLSASGGRGANGAQSWHLAAGHGGCEVIRAGDKLCVHGHGRVIDTQSQSCLSCFSIASIEKPVFFSPWETEVGLGRDNISARSKSSGANSYSLAGALLPFSSVLLYRGLKLQGLADFVGF